MGWASGSDVFGDIMDKLCLEELQPGWHIDHVQPLVLGGPDILSNVLPACPSCNLAEGSKTLEDYLTGVG